ncbi:MAG: penicillin-binding protein 2 [Gammaproteobacteria bacterium]|nr:penicillin-binding protein 2 [Gammaproteobacteria bacterium]MBT6557572.1 penicillin-binding protein 2 [Gammaproteobacteria bacterium]
MKPWRHYLVLCAFLLVGVGLSARVLYLGVTEREFLQQEGDERSVHKEVIPGMRGMIYDRNGEPLAVSTPVFAVTTNPRLAKFKELELQQIADALGLSKEAVRKKVEDNKDKGFLYLKRRLSWVKSNALKQLDISHLTLEPEYQRYYPAGEIASHVVGITDVDGKGIEGLESNFETSLRGHSGAKTVLRDRKKNSIRDLDYLSSPRYGEDLNLTIDLRLQFIAYRELKSAVNSHQAASGSLIMLDAKTGEILAMVNQPSFNPNSGDKQQNTMRNRAVVDAYEPGSTIKPFTALAALESGRYTPETMIDTAPGYFKVGNKLIEDPINRKSLSLGQSIQKSSQVAFAKLALDLEQDAVFDVLARAGFGNYVGVELPGEAYGKLSSAQLKYPVVRATLAYGYGLSVSPIQLAQAYLTLASHGMRLPISIVKSDVPNTGERVFEAQATKDVLTMMELVTAREGTAANAAVSGYRVAGKTGTARMIGANGYDDERHIAWFAGVAPVSDPKVVMIIVINEAKAGRSGGGKVAAPVFARVAERSLRLLGVSPEKVDVDLARAPTEAAAPIGFGERG